MRYRIAVFGGLMGWTCPLTPIEKSLRIRAGQAGYSGGFIQHYVGRAVIYACILVWLPR